MERVDGWCDCTYRPSLFGMVPEIPHPLHQHGLKVRLVGFAFFAAARGPPLSAP